MRRILTVTAQPIRKGEPLLILTIENLRSERPSGDTRTQSTYTEVVALFISPNDHFQGVPGLHVSVVQSADYFDGAHAANVSIEVSAMENGINVRAEEQFRQLLRACAQAEDLSGGIDADLERGLLHQADDVFPSGHIGLRESGARDAALGIPAKLAQFFKRALQTFGIDVELFLLARLR